MFNSSNQAPPTDRLEAIAALRSAVENVMVVSGYTFDQDGVIHLRGRLKLPVEQAYRPLRPQVERLGYTPYLSEEENGVYQITAVPGVIPRNKPDTRVNLWLFIGTVASVIFAGAVLGADEAGLNLGAGLMFAAAVMAILVTHEMGHYVVGRLRGAPVSLPYFIPLPLVGLFGTMGAVIVQREPFEDRRTLLEVGIAGPLAGFIVAVPLMFLGLALSKVQPIPQTGDMMIFGDSLLTKFLTLVQFGPLSPGNDVIAHPVLIAAWFGLLVTGINLIPAGQLDGGHVAYALLGPNARYLSYVMIAGFLGLAAFVSTSWVLWAMLLLLFGRTHPPALNQAAKLEPLHVALAIIALLVLILVFVPNPLYTP